MRFRIALLAVLLLAAFAVVAIAQQPPSTARRQPPVRGEAAGELSLSKNQLQKIRAIVQKYRQDVAAVQKSKATTEQKAAQVKSLRAKASSAIMAVLTPEQRAKAQKSGYVDRLLAPRAAKKRPGILALVWKLDLTAAQKTSIKLIVEKSEAAAKTIQRDTSLKPADKSRKLAALRKGTNEKILAVLTPQQRAKLQEMMRSPRKPL